MDAPIAAALVTGAVALVVLLVQHGLYAERQAKERRLHELKLEEVRTTNTERLRQSERTGDEAAALREARNLSLERLWNAMSIANSAADAMIRSSSTRDLEVLVEQTVKFLREMTPLLTETRAATHNLALSKEDVQLVLAVRKEAVKLFLSLDLDSGPQEQYQRRLNDCKGALGQELAIFKRHIDSIRGKPSDA